MNPLRLGLIIIAVMMLQAGFLPAWRPFGVVPDLLAATVVCLALVATASQALICALAVGLLLDLTSATTFGFNLGFYTVVTLAVALLVRFGIAFDSPSWRVGLSVGTILASHAIILIELATAHADLPFGLVTGRILLAVIFELPLVALVHAVVSHFASGEPTLKVGGIS